MAVVKSFPFWASVSVFVKGSLPHSANSVLGHNYRRVCFCEHVFADPKKSRMILYSDKRYPVPSTFQGSAGMAYVCSGVSVTLRSSVFDGMGVDVTLCL